MTCPVEKYGVERKAFAIWGEVQMLVPLHAGCVSAGKLPISESQFPHLNNWGGHGGAGIPLQSCHEIKGTEEREAPRTVLGLSVLFCNSCLFFFSE